VRDLQGNRLLGPLKRLQNEALAQISQVAGLEALEELRIRYLGRKGSLTQILRGLKDLEP